MNSERLAIVLVNYNGLEDTKACLESIKAVEQQLPFVVIVDNASRNSTELEILHSVYAPLQLIYNKTNLGFE